MKASLILCTILLFMGLWSCTSKDGTPTAMLNENPDTTQLGTLLAQGSFVSDAHQTSGKAGIYSKNGANVLVFENFKTDNGPDLRVYLAQDRSARMFREVGRLKSTNGGFNYVLPSDLEISQYPLVLIWCEDFSVLFGNAELKTAM